MYSWIGKNCSYCGKFKIVSTDFRSASIQLLVCIIQMVNGNKNCKLCFWQSKGKYIL